MFFIRKSMFLSSMVFMCVSQEGDFFVHCYRLYSPRTFSANKDKQPVPRGQQGQSGLPFGFTQEVKFALF